MEYSILDYIAVAVIVIIWNVFITALSTPLETDKQAEPGLSIAAAEGGGTGLNSADDRLTATLARIWALGGGGSREAFLDGARQVYEIVLTAFAAGDLGAEADLLGTEVRRTFREVIAARKARGQVASLTFIGMHTADVVDAGLGDGRAWIEVRFSAEIVSAVRDSEGVVIAGNPEQVTETSEIWTFERAVPSTSMGWTLIATDDAA